jgi:hypothetical protein
LKNPEIQDEINHYLYEKATDIPRTINSREERKQRNLKLF